MEAMGEYSDVRRATPKPSRALPRMSVMRGAGEPKPEGQCEKEKKQKKNVKSEARQERPKMNPEKRSLHSEGWNRPKKS